MSVGKTSRRRFLRAALGGAAVVAAPSALSAQTKSVKLGVVHPVTGALAEPGQACRLGAQMAAEAINANVARAVKDGVLKTQYVYRNFPTASSFGRRAVQYFTEIFREAGVSPRRVVLMYGNDLFGQSPSCGFMAAHRAANPAWEIVDTIVWAEPAADLSAEVSRAKAARPDVIAPITRAASAHLLLSEIRRQRVDVMGIMGPGSPGLSEAGPLAAFKDELEHVLTSVPWPNFKNPKIAAAAEEYRKRSGGRPLDLGAGYACDAVLVAADVLERARSTDPEAIVDALKKTYLATGVMQYGGPIFFNELGDNPNAIPTLIQILSGKPVAVWPRDAALQKFVFPRPRG